MADSPPFPRAILAFPTSDRQRSFRFYSQGLGFATPGEPADDGVPEPLQVVVNDGLWLMLVPTGGFGWVTGGSQLAAPGTVECQLGVTASDRAGVDALLSKAGEAGAAILSPPVEQPWGYSGVFADPDGHQWMVVEEPPA